MFRVSKFHILSAVRIGLVNKRVIRDVHTRNKNTDATKINEVCPTIWTAEQFKLGSRTSYHNGMELADIVLQMNLKRNDIIVDVGCGNGNLTKDISELITHKKVFGFDKLPSMIKYAQDNYSSETIDYFVDDISSPWDQLDARLKNVEGKVNLAFANYVLLHVANKNQALSNMRRLLRKDGYFLFNVVAFPDFKNWELTKEEKQCVKHLDLKTKIEQIELYNYHLSSNGLSLVNMTDFLNEWRYNSKEDMMKMLQPITDAFGLRMMKDNIEKPIKTVHQTCSDLLVKVYTNKNYPNFLGYNFSEDFNLNCFYLNRLSSNEFNENKISLSKNHAKHHDNQEISTGVSKYKLSPGMEQYPWNII